MDLEVFCLNAKKSQLLSSEWVLYHITCAQKGDKPLWRGRFIIEGKCTDIKCGDENPQYCGTDGEWKKAFGNLFKNNNQS